MEEALLEILCAPLTHSALRLASPAELYQINSRIRSRLIRNRTDLTLDAELEGCLICESDGMCYPLRDGFPVMISGEAFDCTPTS